MARKIPTLGVASAVCLLSCSGTPDAQPAGGGSRAPGGPRFALPEIPAIVFLGTSLTAGLGVDPRDAYPALIGVRIDSLELGLRVVNAGVSGETSAGGLRRLPWLLRETVVALVLELGANDGLRGLPVEQLSANLDSIVVLTRAAHPEAVIVIAGMEAPPELGPRYTNAFRAVFVDVADRHRLTRIPFLLAGVAGDPTLNQADGIHPTEEGHRLMAETVWEVLAPHLRGAGRTASDSLRVGGR